MTVIFLDKSYQMAWTIQFAFTVLQCISPVKCKYFHTYKLQHGKEKGEAKMCKHIHFENEKFDSAKVTLMQSNDAWLLFQVSDYFTNVLTMMMSTFYNFVAILL